MRDLIKQIRQSRKYRDICDATIHDILVREFQQPGKTRRHLACAKARLHRVAAFYLGEPDYDQAAHDLRTAFFHESKKEVDEVCVRIMESHASSRERLPELCSIYRTLLTSCGVPRTVVDLACSYNPFAFRWMGLPAFTQLHVYDINQSTVQLLNTYFQLEGIKAKAAVQDVLCEPPKQEADLALLLKMYHCFEHRRRGSGWEVLQSTRARQLAVSFPTRNLHGRRVDIIGNYEALIRQRVQVRGWRCQRIDFESEVFLIVSKDVEGVAEK